MHGIGFVEDLAYVLGVAAVIGVLFRLLHQPSVLGYLIAGLLVGPYLPTPVFANPERVHALSEFGVILVMFAVGLEFRLSKFLSVLPVSGVTGVIQIGVLLWIGFAVGQELGWSEVESLFLGACICISSTMVVSKILDQDPIPSDARRFVFGILVLQDVAAIALIAVMTATARGSGASFVSVLGILGKLVLVLFALIAVGMFVVPRFVRLLVRFKSQETLVVGATGLCFSAALLVHELGYSVALGAFIAGVLVAESGLGTKVEHSIQALRDTFAAVFFVSVGMSVDPRVALANLPTAGILLVVVVLGQLVSVTLGGILSGSGVRRSVTAGLTLGQVGEFAFILAAIGTNARVVRPSLSPILVTVAVCSTLTTSLLLKQRERVVGAVDRLLPARVRHLLTLYEVWFEEIRARSPRDNTPIRRAVRAILLDLFGVVIILLIWKIWAPQIREGVTELLGLPPRRARMVGATAVLLALVPFLVAMTLSARKLTLLAVQRAMGADAMPHARALLRATVALMVVLCIGVPAAAVLKPLLGLPRVWPVLLVAFLIAGAVAWYEAGKLDGDIQSGGEILVRTIAKQGLPEQQPSSYRGASLLPGLTKMRELTLSPGSSAIGKTLADLRLRTVTGANVIALKRADQTVAIPMGSEVLAQGDTLYLAGTRTDQHLAEAYLLEGRVPEARPLESDEPA
jgi:CPA2 family monovalent cation:H+ antiporter-2